MAEEGFKRKLTAILSADVVKVTVASWAVTRRPLFEH